MKLEMISVNSHLIQVKYGVYLLALVHLICFEMHFFFRSWTEEEDEKLKEMASKIMTCYGFISWKKGKSLVCKSRIYLTEGIEIVGLIFIWSFC